MSKTDSRSVTFTPESRDSSIRQCTRSPAKSRSPSPYPSSSEESDSDSEIDSLPVPTPLFTGEYRTPLRERVQKMPEAADSNTTAARPGTPLPKRSSSSLRTPTLPSLPSVRECPDAPTKKGKVFDLRRQFAQDSGSADKEDVLLDRRANKQGAALAKKLTIDNAHERRVSGMVTPGRGSPLRHSTSAADELADMYCRGQTFEDLIGLVEEATEEWLAESACLFRE
ncbi:Uu.00g067410.m01.CDS01 [Anthostomella pinea]|uniref:Uu.00g067410.m01.CDS01 n=1 Tax=Anthostomella pinea TaxID=933095 RepID=A0AAI8VU59_9PEZI|nr:Uu.00g067410.m01.CDS01 [Anthostomella pinea]